MKSETETSWGMNMSKARAAWRKDNGVVPSQKSSVHSEEPCLAKKGGGETCVRPSMTQPYGKEQRK